MTQGRPRYYVTRRRRGFWQPTRRMRAFGFYSVPCGFDGPGAWAIAEQWNERWDAARATAMVRPPDASLEFAEATYHTLAEVARAVRRRAHLAAPGIVAKCLREISHAIEADAMKQAPARAPFGWSVRGMLGAMMRG